VSNIPKWHNLFPVYRDGKFEKTPIHLIVAPRLLEKNCIFQGTIFLARYEERGG
jgi:hypothetical protein